MSPLRGSGKEDSLSRVVYVHLETSERGRSSCLAPNFSLPSSFQTFSSHSTRSSATSVSFLLVIASSPRTTPNPRLANQPSALSAADFVLLFTSLESSKDQSSHSVRCLAYLPLALLSAHFRCIFSHPSYLSRPCVQISLSIYRSPVWIGREALMALSSCGFQPPSLLLDPFP